MTCDMGRRTAAELPPTRPPEPLSTLWRGVADWRVAVESGRGAVRGCDEIELRSMDSRGRLSYIAERDTAFRIAQPGAAVIHLQIVARLGSWFLVLGSSSE